MDRTQIALLLLLLPAVLPRTSSSITSAERYIEQLSSWLSSHQVDVSSYLPGSRPQQPWPYRHSASATSIKLTRTHAWVATVSHHVLPGVTTDMLVWWFNNVEGSATYPGDGQQWPKYLMWHPRDHIYQVTLKSDNTSSKASTASTPAEAAAAEAAAAVEVVAAGTAAPLWEICEYFQCSTSDGYTSGSYPGPAVTKHEVLIKAATAVLQLDHQGLWLSVPSRTGLGDTFWNLWHSWLDTPDGVLVNSTQVVGVQEPAWRPLWFARARNAMIRGLFSQGHHSHQVLSAWVQHCIEEIGNLEHILPSLYAEAQGSSSSSDSNGSAAGSSGAPAAGSTADDGAGRQNADDVPDAAQPFNGSSTGDHTPRPSAADEL